MAKPDWVLVGLQEDGAYRIFASQTLSRAVVESRVSLNRRTGRVTSSGSTLTADMGDIVAISGTSYLDALQKLFHEWQPVSVRPPELEQPE